MYMYIPIDPFLDVRTSKISRCVVCYQGFRSDFGQENTRESAILMISRYTEMSHVFILSNTLRGAVQPVL